MTIRAVSRQEFASFNTDHLPFAILPDRGVEWFADDADVVIGVLSFALNFDWSISVLDRDHDRGTFSTFDVDAGIANLDDARHLLFATMNVALRGKGRAVAIATTSFERL